MGLAVVILLALIGGLVALFVYFRNPLAVSETPTSELNTTTEAIELNTTTEEPGGYKEYPKYIGHFLLEFLIRR